MSAHRAHQELLLLVVAIAMSWSGALHAASICTLISQSSEHPVPLDERESLREIQNRVLPGHLTDGDRHAAAGERLEAYGAYLKIFESIQDRGVHYGTGRCLSSEFYQRAADKLRIVASEVSVELLEQGIYEGGSPPRDQPGALRLLLASNQYDAFVEHAFEHAANELPEREIGLQSLVQRRLTELDQIRSAGEIFSATDIRNDLTPLLDEELAAFDKLVDFENRLKAHLAPLYPRITDHWLAEESNHFDVVINADSNISKGMTFGPASVALGRSTDALKRGLKRLQDQPAEVVRLQARANGRGDALMKRQQFRAAEMYFKIAKRDDLVASAGRMADTQESETAKKQGATLQSILEGMQKDDDEQSAFQDEAEEMAAEFDFDLEE